MEILVATERIRTQVRWSLPTNLCSLDVSTGLYVLERAPWFPLHRPSDFLCGGGLDSGHYRRADSLLLRHFCSGTYI